MTAPQPAPPQPGQPLPAPPAPQQPQQGQPGQFPQQVGADQQQTAPGQHQVPNPWSGLLDVAPPQQGQQGQQPWPPQGQNPYPAPQGPVGFDPSQMADLIGRAVQSAVDRRVNQLTNPQWQQAHGQPPQQTPPPGAPAQYPPPNTSSTTAYQYTPPGPSEADQREARMAAREYLNDRVTFGSEAERAMAVDLTAALIPAQLLLGMTPNSAALAVAQTVAERVTSLRRDYEDRAVRGLRSRGLLVESAQPQVPAGMAGSVGVPVGGTPVSTATAQHTAAKAARLAAWATEENTQRGWETTPATAASG